MTFPLINKIYEYNGQKVQVWQQDLFIKVYLKTQPDTGGVYFLTENWWKFMLKSKFLFDAPKLSTAY